MLDRQKHEQVLKNILRDIYTTTDLEARLIFKGGSCLYLFYGLDRFSVDLDFNLIGKDFNERLMSDILSRYLKIDDFMNKYFSWIWLGSYEKGGRKVKVEINKRKYPDKYTNKDFYGLTIPTLSADSMFSHKLCAITDRKRMQNRDLYDAHFMFSGGFDINEKIIKIRTGKTLKGYFSYLIKFIEKNVKPNTILIKDLLFDFKSRMQ